MQVSEVFGISKTVPKSYVEREAVDGVFRSLLASDRFISVFGGSKQGKSSLRMRWLDNERVIYVRCGTEVVSKRSLYSLLLRDANVPLRTSTSKTAASTASSSANLALSSGLVQAGIGTGSGSSNSEEISSRFLDIDLGNANDIARTLAKDGFAGFVVLEDFHRLDEKVQREVADDLKTFYEYPGSGVRFVILGVWLEPGRLRSLCGELAGRIESVNAGRWDDGDLRKVISNGAKLLNVGFADLVVEALVRGCFSNIGILQQACERLCLDSKVSSAEEDIVKSTAEVDRVFGTIVEAEKGRFVRKLRMISQGFGRTDLEVYKWIVRSVLELGTAAPSKLTEGISKNLLVSRICSAHNKRALMDRNKHVITASLKRLRLLQQRNGSEYIFDFIDDHLQVLDDRFILVLANYDSSTLIRELGMREGATLSSTRSQDEVLLDKLPSDSNHCRFCGERPDGDPADPGFRERLQYHETVECEAVPDYLWDG